VKLKKHSLRKFEAAALTEEEDIDLKSLDDKSKN
jgi:hypothetical protein